MTRPALVTRYDQIITFGQTPKNAYNTVDVPSPPVPEEIMLSPVYAATPPPLDIRKGGKRLSVKHQSSGGKTLKGEIPLRKNLPGWLRFVGIKLRLRPEDPFHRFLYFQSLTLQTCEWCKHRVSSEVNLLRGWPWQAVNLLDRNSSTCTTA